MKNFGRVLGRGCVLGFWMSVWLPAARSDLFSYMERQEPEFRWEKRKEAKQGTGTIYDLHLVSQVWQGIKWEHRIQVFHPQKLEYPNIALLFITGGGGDGEAMQYGSMMANATGSPFAILYHIPNQPLFENLTEDNLIAHTFVKFLETGDDNWPLLLPMAKSAVKAMDALQAFSEKEWGQKLEGFIITGASKRGWTTWLTAVVDKRVVGIAPMVYDNLNIPAQMRHQREVFGGYSEQISEYTQRGLTDLADTDLARPLLQIVDPYFHRERLKMPKLIINGTNDRYWALDALNFYWNDLPDDKYVLYVPNSGHDLEDRGRVISTLVAFFRHVAAKKPFVNLTWNHEEKDGKLRLSVTSEAEPREVRLWVARSETKDFRSAKWESSAMHRSSDAAKAFVGEVSKPDKGFVALFGEAVYEYEQDGRTFTLSTAIRISGGP